MGMKTVGMVAAASSSCWPNISGMGTGSLMRTSWFRGTAVFRNNATAAMASIVSQH